MPSVVLSTRAVGAEQSGDGAVPVPRVRRRPLPDAPESFTQVADGDDLAWLHAVGKLVREEFLTRGPGSGVQADLIRTA